MIRLEMRDFPKFKEVLHDCKGLGLTYRRNRANRCWEEGAMYFVEDADFDDRGYVTSIGILVFTEDSMAVAFKLKWS